MKTNPKSLQKQHGYKCTTEQTDHTKKHHQYIYVNQGTIRVLKVKQIHEF